MINIGHITPSASRLGGGLFPVVQCLTREISKRDIHVKVFSVSDEFVTQDFKYWYPVDLNLLNRLGPKSFSYTPRLFSALNGSSLDLIHLHGLWNFSSYVIPKWGQTKNKPWVISPHGMLDKWALNNSAWKKKVAAFLYENRNLRGASCLHATCLEEAAAFRAYGLENQIAVIPNGVDLPSVGKNGYKAHWASEIGEDAKILLYLGRLHPKKGLMNLIESWAYVKNNLQSNWILIIAGWDQLGHQFELENQVRLLGVSDSVRFVGALFNDDKSYALLRANAFVLPSTSEGLPMAILEAWSYSLPVLMTPECNIDIGYKKGAAIKICTDINSISNGLLKLFNMSDQDRTMMGLVGKDLVKHSFSWSSVTEKMVTLYNWILNGGQRPEFII
jgi:poly(glycerol-phosphate) alpha-glucosyltransferase